MAKREFNRPDEAAMERVLERTRTTIAEAILRLAWQAGLSVTEMDHLKWAEVSLETGELILPDRTVPTGEALGRCLAQRLERPELAACEYVMTTDKRFTHMHRVHISNFARAALDTEATLRKITLTDLREDFVIRQLETRDWTEAMRICGISMSTLNSRYGQFKRKEHHKKRGAAPTTATLSADDEYRLWQLIQREDTSPVGLSLWMVWQLGLSLPEIAALTWEQVDLETGVICLADRQVETGVALRRRLRRVSARRAPQPEEAVLLTPRTARAFRPERLSVVVGEALNRAGITGLDMAALAQVQAQTEKKQSLLALLEKKGYLTKQDAEAVMQGSSHAVYRQLHQLIEEGTLVRVGTRYYPAEAVVPPERQRKVILSHLGQSGAAKRKTLAELLGIGDKQCAWILSELVREGALCREGIWYSLPEEKN